MILTPYAQPQRPRDRAAMQRLQDAYALAKSQRFTTTLHPWPRAVLVELGRLYVRAWGVVPIPGRMLATWCLPEARAILREFGSYAAYYAALEEEDTR
jgi:hypothetical protein